MLRVGTNLLGSLATVNFFLGCVGAAQVTRILMYQQSLKNGDLSAVVKEDAKDMKNAASSAATDVEIKAKQATQ